jgi:antitoxin (DNA-binding transcriptional repressor) of toxin-antitoxin stability system
MTLRVSEAELAADLHGFVEKVQAGAEVVIEEDGQTVAVLRAPPVGRKLSEIIDSLDRAGAQAVADDQYGQDVEAARAANSKPRNPPSWG